MQAQRIGVLLLNLGTPDATDYWSMRRYLKEFLSDERVIDVNPLIWKPLLNLVILTTRPSRSGRAYAAIWNRERDESPLRTITREQCVKLTDALGRALPDQELLIDWAMRYGNPSTASAIRRMVAAGCTRLLLFALYPQYAAATTATAYDEAFRALGEERWQPAVRTAPPYFEHPGYIEALARSIEAAPRAPVLAARGGARLVSRPAQALRDARRSVPRPVRQRRHGCCASVSAGTTTVCA